MRTVHWIAQSGSGTGLLIAGAGVVLWALRVSIGLPLVLTGTGLMLVGAVACGACVIVYTWRERRRPSDG